MTNFNYINTNSKIKLKSKMSNHNISNDLLNIFIQIKTLCLGVIFYWIGIWVTWIPKPSEIISGIIMSALSAISYYTVTKIIKFIEKKTTKK